MPSSSRPSYPHRTLCVRFAIGVLVATAARAQTPDERKAQIQDLERRGAPVELVAPHLDDTVASVRAAAIVALGRSGDARAASALARCLGEPCDDARHAAVHALGVLGSAPSLPALFAALRSTDPEDRAAAARGIGVVCQRETELDDAARAAAFEELLPLLTDRAAAPREAAALAIGATGWTAAVAALAAQLEHADRALRWRLVHGIGQLGGEAATLALAREAARDPAQPWCQELAARFLAEAPFPAAAEPLARLARHPSPLVSAPAAWGLAAHARRDPDGTIPALTRALATHPAWATRAEAARALGTLAQGEPLADTAMIAIRTDLERARATDPSATVRAVAAEAQVALEPERAADLLERARSPLERAGVARALGATLSRADVPAARSEAWFAQARATLAGDEPALRLALAAGIAPSATGEAYDLVASMLGAQDPDLRAVAAAALARAVVDPPPEMAGAFAQALTTAVGDEMAPARANLVRLLARTKSRAAIAPCQAALRDPRRVVRAEARDALAALTSERPSEDGPVAPAPSFPGSDLPVPTRPVVILETSKGDIEIALDPAAAPLRVRAFLFWVDRGYYAGRAIDLVVPGRTVQGGAPRVGGFGDAGVTTGAGHLGLRDEPSPLPFEAGTVGMPPAGVDAGGGALLFALAPAPELVGRCTAIGRVTRGLGTLDRLEVGDRLLAARRVR